MYDKPMVALNTGSIKRKPGQGHPRATTAKEDCHLSIIARRNGGTTASQLSRYLYAATGTRVSRVTVSKTLHERWFSRRPVACIPLTSIHGTDNTEIGLWINGQPVR
ncbi:HTH_Tnp_Tc3_2 domain-containing protein [Trichonephila clavipes]|nr:HTH_Tnp_Tc3_2 domain-containing protein [Trichonephila clavipes]